MAFDYVEIAEEGRFLPWGRVAAEKVDEMEQWIANANAMVVNANPITQSADKTYNEIITPILSGRTVILKDNNNTYYNFLGYDNYTVKFSKTSASGANRNLNTIYISKSNNKASAEGYRFLPSVSTLDNGCELVADGGQWVTQKKKFVVTFTPVNADYSGTMDKTVGEINTAYESGMDIVARIMLSETSYVESPLHTVIDDGVYDYPSFEGYVVQSRTNVLIYAFTGTTNNADGIGYTTKLYTLTPVSSGS